MRRKDDGWVNATHILKVANFDKPQRTRILEKEIQKGIHKKVQGGYGRYQGTWVPVEVARQIAGQYNVLDDLAHLFDYVESPDNPPPFVKNISSAAKAKAKMQAAAANANSQPLRSSRRDQHLESSLDPNLPGSPSSCTSASTRKPRVQSTAASKKSAGGADLILSASKQSDITDSNQDQQIPPVKRGRGRPKGASNKNKRPSSSSSFDQASQRAQPFVRPKKQARTDSFNLRAPQPLPLSNGSSGPVYPQSLEVDSASLSDDSSSMSEGFLSDQNDSAQNNYLINGGYDTNNSSGALTPAQSIRSSQAFESIPQSMSQHNYPYISKPTQEITDTPSFSSILKSRRSSSADSFDRRTGRGEDGDQLAQNASISSDNLNSNRSVTGLVYGAEDLASKYSSQILDKLIMGQQENEDFSEESILPPPGLDINHVIDEDGHTVFHWACSLGTPPVVNGLLKNGANIRAPNLLGQTPLMRSIMFKNNFDLRTFSKIVDVLRDTITMKDHSGRTVLHHIADSASQKSKRSAAKYYNALLLAKLAEVASRDEMKKFVNMQDNHGDTALHIAAKFGATKIFKELKSFGGDETLLNADGLVPKNYFSKYEAEKRQHNFLMQPYSHSRHNNHNGNNNNAAYQKGFQKNTNGLGINVASSTPNQSAVYSTYTDQSYTTQLATPSNFAINGNSSTTQIPQNMILNSATPTQSNIRDLPVSRPHTGPSDDNNLHGHGGISGPVTSSTPGNTSLGSGIISSSTPTSSSSPKNYPPFGIFQTGVAEARPVSNGTTSTEPHLLPESNILRPNAFSMGSRKLSFQTSAKLEESSDGQALVGQITLKPGKGRSASHNSPDRFNISEANQEQSDTANGTGKHKDSAKQANSSIKLTDKSTFSFLPSALSIVANRAAELEADLAQVAKTSSQEISETSNFLSQINKRLSDIETKSHEEFSLIKQKLKELDMDFDKEKWEQEEWVDPKHASGSSKHSGSTNEAAKRQVLATSGPYSNIIAGEIEYLQGVVKDYELKLRKTLERSQARDVARHVQLQEALMVNEIRQELSEAATAKPVSSSNRNSDIELATDGVLDNETLDLLLDLHILQHRRKSEIESLVKLWGDAIPDDKKSNAFRRLIAKACNVPEYQIDKILLNSIIGLLINGEDDEEGIGSMQGNETGNDSNVVAAAAAAISAGDVSTTEKFGTK